MHVFNIKSWHTEKNFTIKLYKLSSSEQKCDNKNKFSITSQVKKVKLCIEITLRNEDSKNKNKNENNDSENYQI